MRSPYPVNLMSPHSTRRRAAKGAVLLGVLVLGVVGLFVAADASQFIQFDTVMSCKDTANGLSCGLTQR
jgi:hypothetical protein